MAHVLNNELLTRRSDLGLLWEHCSAATRTPVVLCWRSAAGVCVYAILSLPLHFSFLCWCNLRVHITPWTAVSGWYWIMSEWSVMSTCRKCGLSSCQDIEKGQQNETLWEWTLQAPGCLPLYPSGRNPPLKTHANPPPKISCFCFAERFQSDKCGWTVPGLRHSM